MVSVVGTTAMTSAGMPRAAMVSIAASTAAAPAMSAFIRCMSFGPLREMPPVSKVIPLPMMASVVPSSAPRWRRRISRGGSSEPAATPSRRL